MGLFNARLKFEWDEDKNRQNVLKHGLSFHTAAKVFDDVLRIEIFDEAHSEYEDRYITIGLVNDVIFVIYTMRKDAIRIISARMANKEEEKIYYGSKI